jgi:ribonuclease E
VIDVNTGKFTGTGGNLEATVTSNNLEAAEEIVRQLRLRDIGGIIVIDFIYMVLPSNRELLLRRLVESLGRDRTRHQVAEITSLGLVQMTRKRIGTGLLEAFSTECPQCHGRGYELHDMPVESHRHADGGARDSRPRDRRSNAQTVAGSATQSATSADAADASNEPAPEERPARGRRSSRSRLTAAGQEQDASEPQIEPVVSS